eukprot:TRINITY_DN2931_c4_g1_i1.p1 TRINITY_DN2931_c4_g1~~TRINITY_DN2931_c4_g1_i1.p1  ORF type:complete len:382 (+),score=63.28 TRINITY_DN2931_c4_g1_i1:96-1241(+)
MEWNTYGADELRKMKQEKEKEGAVEVGAPSLTLESEHALRMSGVGFLWECGFSERLSTRSIAEAECNSKYSKKLRAEEGELFTTFDTSENKNLIKAFKAQSQACKDLSTPETNDFSQRNRTACLQAILIYHHFFLKKSFRQYDRFLTAAAALLIAYKSQNILPLPGKEAPLDSVQRCIRQLLPNRYKSNEYRVVIKRLEMKVLDATRFSVSSRSAVDVARMVCKRIEAPEGVEKLSLAVITDSYLLTDICVRYEVECIGIAGVLLGIAATPEPYPEGGVPALILDFQSDPHKALPGYNALHAKTRARLHDSYIRAAWLDLLSMYRQSGGGYDSPPLPIPVLEGSDRAVEKRKRDETYIAAMKRKISKTVVNGEAALPSLHS